MARYEQWKIKRIGDEVIVERLKNKQTGGRSFRDGRDYEVAYALHLIIIEIAKILIAYRASPEIGKFRKFAFDPNPDCFVDDFGLIGLTGELLVQLKLGGINWDDIVRDFKIQGRMDKAHNTPATYRLVNGSSKSAAWLRKRLDDEGLINSEAVVFRYSKNFHKYRASHPDLANAMSELTGSTDAADQEVAYAAFLYHFWNSTGKRSLVEFIGAAAQDLYSFLSPLEEYDDFKFLEQSIMARVADCQVRVVGRVMYLEADGFFQRYIVPFDLDHVANLISSLEAMENPTVDDLEGTLRDLKWNFIVRRPQTWHRPLNATF